jgi:hypothetical protein
MLVTSRRQQITAVLAGLMLRTVPGTVIELAEFKQLAPLFIRKFSPEIHLLEFSGWSSNFSLLLFSISLYGAS